jgi:tRNA 2-thiouridine synthesizing protein A
MADVHIDCKGLACPIPIVKVSRAIKQMEAGDRLVVEASDASFKPDIEAWSRRMGHPIVEFAETAGVQRAVLVKK